MTCILGLTYIGYGRTFKSLTVINSCGVFALIAGQRATQTHTSAARLGLKNDVERRRWIEKGRDGNVNKEWKTRRGEARGR